MGADDVVVSNGAVVKLVTWDITGNSEYSALTSAFYQGVVYTLTRHGYQAIQYFNICTS